MTNNPTILEYIIGGFIFFFVAIIPLAYTMNGRDPFEFFTDIKKMFKKRGKNGK
jgi:hypothetical protein